MDFLFQKIKEDVEHEDNSDTNCNWGTWKGLQSIQRGLEESEIKEKIETVQITVLLRSTRILRWVLETGVDLLSPRLQWKKII